MVGQSTLPAASNLAGRAQVTSSEGIAPGLGMVSVPVLPNTMQAAMERPTGVATPTTTMASVAVSTSVGPATPATPLAMPLLGHHLPQIPKFSGDTQDSGETIAEWLEQFDNIAKSVGWDDHWRLVHLTSNLRGTAAAYY